MFVEKFEAEYFEIRGAPQLDPIQVCIQDMGMQRGRITVTCFGSAWTAYWGSMGCETVSEFVTRMDAPYFCNKLAPPSNQTKAQEKYRMRIAEAVKQVISIRFREQQKPAGIEGTGEYGDE